MPFWDVSRRSRKWRTLHLAESNNNLLRRLLRSVTTGLIDDQVRRARIMAAQALLRIQSPRDSFTGTGFFISPDGFLLTARHIAHGLEFDESGDCAAFLRHGVAVRCVLVADISNVDLTLMKVDGLPSCTYLHPETRISPDSSVALIGFGLDDPGLLHVANVTTGTISTIRTTATGQDNVDQLCTANINTGDSGGPVLSLSSDQFVGVVHGIARAASVDQGQASFHLTTENSELWQIILHEMESYRSTH